MKLTINLIILVGMMVSCKPSDPPKPIEPSIAESEIVWKLAADSNGLKFDGGHPLIYNNHLIVGIEKSGGFMIRSYDLETNEIIWENNNMPSSNFWPKRISNIHCKDNILALSSGPRILVLNMDNGKEIWRIELNNGDTWSVLIGDWIYKSDYNKQLETLYRYNLMTGTREKVLELGLVDGYSPGIMMPVKWTSPAGDEILVLQNRTFNWAGVG
jgi:hypothetical protein